MSEDIKTMLSGIDETEIGAEDGWWETSTGANFGEEKLKEVIAYIDDLNASHEEELNEKQRSVNGLLHNLSVIESELSCVQEAQCSISAWDRVCLALEFAEDDNAQPNKAEDK